MEMEAGKDEFIVFLKASEEAEMIMTDRKFTWLDTGLPSISGATTTFDTTLNDWVLTLTGTNFGTSSAGVEIYIDGSKQAINSISDT